VRWFSDEQPSFWNTKQGSMKHFAPYILRRSMLPVQYKLLLQRSAVNVPVERPNNDYGLCDSSSSRNVFVINGFSVFKLTDIYGVKSVLHKIVPLMQATGESATPQPARKEQASPRGQRPTPIFLNNNNLLNFTTQKV